MQAKQKLRMTLDITMTLFSVTLMGGTMLFYDERVHQVLGMALLLLWAAHIALNRRWSPFRGSYPPKRIMQIVVNCAIFLCALLVGISGMMMAWFLPFSFGADFARKVHLVSSHWYYIFMSFHIGMHAGMIFSRVKAKRAEERAAVKTGASYKKIVFCILIACVCGYGLYAFIARAVWKYMFLLQAFFFLDLGNENFLGYLKFVLDYLSILVLFAGVSHCISKLLEGKLLSPKTR